VISSQHIDQRCTSYKLKKTSIESWFLTYE